MYFIYFNHSGIQNMEQISHSDQASMCASKPTGKPKKPCPILKCPNEIIRNVSDYLKLADIHKLMRTSRHLHTILDIPFHNRAPHHTCKEGYSILEWAATNNNVTLIQKLQAPWRQKELSSDSKNRALYLATTYDHLSCVSLLFAMGAEACVISDGPKVAELIALHFAATHGKFDAIQLLLAHGADIEIVDRRNAKALQLAFENGHEACAQLLLEKGADVRSINLAIPIAAENESMVLRYLEMGVDPTIAPFNWTPCYVAMIRCMPLMKPLLEKGADPDLFQYGHKCTLLHCAILLERVEATQLLLGYGANVSARDDDGLQPLHIAAGATTYREHQRGNMLASHCLNKEIIQLLLGAGARILDTDDLGHTALDYALHSGGEDIIKLMLQETDK